MKATNNNFKFSIIPKNKIQVFKPIIEKKLNWKFIDFTKKENNCFVFVFGGDGEFLRFLHKNIEKNLKIIFVSIGRVGFLSSIKYNQLDQLLNDIQNQKFEKIHYLKLKVNTDEYIGINEIKFSFNKLTNSKIFINENEFIDSYSSEFIAINYLGTTGLARSYRYPIISRECPQFIFDILDSPQYWYNQNLNQPIILNYKNKITINLIEYPRYLYIKHDNFLDEIKEISNLEIIQCETKCKILNINNTNLFFKKIKELFKEGNNHE